MKFISIIIPVFNAEKYLPETFRSLSLQDDFELILVDDGSTDSSLQICREYAATKSNVKVFTQSNGGPSKARNFGVSQATGEYITFLDADDGFSVGALEKACTYLKENPVDILFQQIQRSTMDGKNYFTLEYQENIVLDHKALQTLWCRNDALIKGYLCGKIYRRSLLKGITFPEDMRFAEDMYSLSDIFMKVKTACMFSEGAYIYYERENTPTTSDWNIMKSRQLVKSFLHRWTCAMQEDLSLKDQIYAWYSALRLFIAERNMFSNENWTTEQLELQNNHYALFSCLSVLSGFRTKVGLIKNLLQLRMGR